MIGQKVPEQVVGPLCSQVPLCGNGQVEQGEECDDGNTAPGDGCAMDCKVEKCFGVVCKASDECHAVGICDPDSGNCSNPAATDGTGCGEGKVGDCQAGVCVGGKPGGDPSSVSPVFNCVATDTAGASPVPNDQTIYSDGNGHDNFIVMDVNQDGRDDIISAPRHLEALPLRVFLSNGTGLSPPTTISQGDGGAVIKGTPDSDPKYFKAIDVNGDGLTDLMMLEGESISIYMHDGKKADMVTAFHSGTGATTSVTYSPWKETMETTTCKHPLSCPKRGLWVVSEHKLDPGPGDDPAVSYDYSYSGARIDMLGRGWLGFSTRTTTDAQTGEVRVVTADNATRRGTSYPFAERPATVTDTVTLADGRALKSKTTMTYKVVAGNVDQAGQPYAMGLDTADYTQVEIAAIGGAETTLRHSVETFQYDSYGNVSYRERKGMIAGTVDSTTATYLNDTTNWILSRPTSVESISKINGESASRKKSYEYYPNSSRLLKKVTVQPDGDTSQHLEITYTRNDLGLPKTITAVDKTGETRTTTIEYDDIEGSRPTVVTDPVGLVTHTAYHMGLNLPVWQQDANGLEANWTYDRFGRIRLASPPNHNDVSTSYKTPSAGGAYQVDRSSASGAKSSVVYDPLGRAVRSSWAGFNGKTSVVVATYDPSFPDKVEKLSLPRFEDDTSADKYTVATYDNAGRMPDPRTRLICWAARRGGRPSVNTWQDAGDGPCRAWASGGRTRDSRSTARRPQVTSGRENARMTQVCSGAAGTKAPVWETALSYVGAGTASAQRTFACLRSHHVPAGKTTSREPSANLPLAET